MNYNIIRGALVCPVCGESLAPGAGGHAVACLGARTHCFDIAASGYINLAGPKRSGAGDPKESVRARGAFLAAGYYKPFADAVAYAVSECAAGGFVIDAGCGEGYYTLKIAKDAGVSACGFDLSKHAVEAAAKAANRAGLDSLFCVAGLFGMPVRAGCADAVVNIFAPSAEDEFARVLKPGGYLVTAGAGPEHLFGLKSALYDSPTKNEPRADLPKGLTLLASRRVRFALELGRREDIAALFSMTPYYYRTKKADAERLARLDTLATEADIELFVYKKEF